MINFQADNLYVQQINIEDDKSSAQNEGKVKVNSTLSKHLKRR